MTQRPSKADFEKSRQIQNQVSADLRDEYRRGLHGEKNPVEDDRRFVDRFRTALIDAGLSNVVEYSFAEAVNNAE